MYSDSIDQEKCSDEMIKIEKNLTRKLDYIYVMPCICILVVVQVFFKKHTTEISIYL